MNVYVVEEIFECMFGGIGNNRDIGFKDEVHSEYFFDEVEAIKYYINKRNGKSKEDAQRMSIYVGQADVLNKEPYEL